MGEDAQRIRVAGGVCILVMLGGVACESSAGRGSSDAVGIGSIGSAGTTDGGEATDASTSEPTTTNESNDATTPVGSSGNDEDAKFDIGSADSGDVPNSRDCVGLTATIRDFQSSHPDFETYGGDTASVGLVEMMLGGDNTPTYNAAYGGPQMITSATTFADWYHNIAGTNMAFPVDLPLTDQGNGEYVFDSMAFFPLDGMGFGNEGNPHNYHFTTEVHTSFTYHGGEVFTFRGDDDVWLFVNGALALDLGGLHPALEGSAMMDSLGLTPGMTYPMDIFHAERHTDESNFRIVTTIDCFQPPEG